MKPTILQRLLFTLLVLGALVLGVVVASGFFLLTLVLIPVVLVRFYLHKRAFEKAMAARREQSQQQTDNQFERTHSTRQNHVIEGEIISKHEEDDKG